MRQYLNTRQLFLRRGLQLDDFLHQMLRGGNFFGSGFSVPGLALDNLLGQVERGEVIFLGASLLVPHILPLLLPSLHRIRELQIEVFCFGSYGDDSVADIIDSVPQRIASEQKNLLPQPEVGVDAKKTLAKSDENSDMENGIWC